jgi:hypothetical protein
VTCKQETLFIEALFIVIARSVCDAAICHYKYCGSDCRVAKRLLAMTATQCLIFIPGGVGRRWTVLTCNDNSAIPVTVKALWSRLKKWAGLS